MAIEEFEIQRFSLVSSRTFDQVVSSLEAAIAHPDVRALSRGVAGARNSEELEQLVGQAVGSSELMEFMRLDIGAVLRLYGGEQAPRSLRLLVGNPLIMKRMVEHVPDAASYAPVTLLDR